MFEQLPVNSKHTMYFQKMQFLGVFHPFLQRSLTYQPISGYHEPIFKTRIKVVGGGGVGIYVRSQYERELCEKLTAIEYKVKHLEFVAIEVSLEDFWKVLIIGIFRPTGKVIHPKYSKH